MREHQGHTRRDEVGLEEEVERARPIGAVGGVVWHEERDEQPAEAARQVEGRRARRERGRGRRVGLGR